MKISIYNEFEFKIKKRYNEFKLKILLPIVYILHKLKISPNFVSFIGFLFSFLFYLKLAIFKGYSNILIILLLYIFFDNLDGSLANYEKADEDVGTIIDSFFDLTSLFLILMGLSAIGKISYTDSLVFILLYWFIIFGGIIANFNNLKILILRLRIIIFTVFILNNLFERPIIDLNICMKYSILAQAFSAFTIMQAFIIHRKKIQIPKVLLKSFANIKIMAYIALLIVAGVFIKEFNHFF